MGKHAQKLLVYLDQNFLSNMSKADINEKVRPGVAPFRETNSQDTAYRSIIIVSARRRKGSMLRLPVKRRRATLASDPSRNSRPELIADDGQGMLFPACPIPRQRPDRKAGHAPGVKEKE
jgi:hypothetical protein